MISEDDISDAWKRFGATVEGAVARIKLQRVAVSIAPPNIKVGTLRDWEGRRRFALELMALMDEGLPETEPVRAGKREPDQPIRVKRRQPVVIGKRRGTGRRVQPYSDDTKSS